MGLAVKFLLVLLVVAVAGGFVINQIPSLKQRVIDVINPAAKEGRLLGELKVNLDDIGSALGGLDVKNPKSAQAELQKSKNLLRESQNLLSNIADINQQNSGIIKQQIGKIIDAFTDRSPYPADHIATPTPASPTQTTCSPAH